MNKQKNIITKAKKLVKELRELHNDTDDSSLDLWYQYMEKNLIDAPYQTKELIAFLARSFWALSLIIFFFGVVWIGLYMIINQTKKPESKILIIGVLSPSKTIVLSKVAQDSLTAYYMFIDKEVRALALAAYWESRYEPKTGQEAIMHVIINRVFSSKFPNTVRGVVYQNNGKYYQFSFLNPKGAHAGAVGRYIQLPNNKHAARILQIAKNVYAGKTKRPLYLKGIMRYMNPAFVTNKMKQIWRRTHRPIIRIASHEFWRKK